MGFHNRFDHEPRLLDEIVEAAAGRGIAASVNTDRGFEEIGGRHAAIGSGREHPALCRDRRGSRSGYPTAIPAVFLSAHPRGVLGALIQNNATSQASHK